MFGFISTGRCLVFAVFCLFLPLAEASSIAERAVPFAGLAVPSQLIEFLAQKKAVLIGEVHGTNEMPEYTFELVRELSQKRTVALGLEFPKQIEPEVRSFLKTGDEAILQQISFFRDASTHSGRGSRAMIEFLRKLRTLRIEVFCFDVAPHLAGPDRDTKMAENILAYQKAHPSRSVVTYSGNIHSRLANGYPGNPTAKNMGAELLRLSEGRLTSRNSTSILYRFSEGTAWWCFMEAGKASPSCGLNTFGPSLEKYATEVPFDRYYLRERRDGHSNVVFIRQLSASLPFFGSLPR